MFCIEWEEPIVNDRNEANFFRCLSGTDRPIHTKIPDDFEILPPEDDRPDTAGRPNTSGKY